MARLAFLFREQTGRRMQGRIHGGERGGGGRGNEKFASVHEVKSLQMALAHGTHRTHGKIIGEMSSFTEQW
jgi:hypothetical protein